MWVTRLLRFQYFLLLVLLTPGCSGSDSILYLERNDLFVWRKKIQVDLRERNDSVRILYLGDSQIMGGIVPSIVEKTAHLHGYNLGLPAQQPEGMEALLPHVFRTFPSLRYAIINVGPYTLLENDNRGAFLSYYRSTLLPGSLVSPVMRYGRWDLVGGRLNDAIGTLLGFLPVLSLQPVTHRIVGFDDPEVEIAHSTLMRYPQLISKEAWIQTTEEPWNPIERVTRQKLSNRKIAALMKKHAGFWIWHTIEEPGLDSPDLCHFRSNLKALPVRGRFSLRKEAIESYRRIDFQFKQNGVKVYYLVIPLSDRWWQMAGEEVASLYTVAQTDLEKEVEGRFFPGPPVEGGRAEDFHDFTHLSGCGAVKLSTWVGHELARDQDQ